MRIIHIEIDKKSTFIMIFGNGLKKFDFARPNLDGRAKCLAQKMQKTLLSHLSQSFGT